MDLDSLNESFALPGVLHFAEENGMLRAEIAAPAGSATVYLQGGHVTHWRPAGHQPVLFLSARSEFALGKAIRGGVPVIAPWFGPDTGNRAAGKPGPSHGYARISLWTVAFAALVGQDVHLTLTLGPDDLSRSLGYPDLRLAYQITVGERLTLQLTIANGGTAPVLLEEALHSYLAVADVRQTRLRGLGGVGYVDKMDNGQHKMQAEDPVILTGPTDRIYLHTESTCVVEDPGLRRRLIIEKENSRSTVVWNPWTELTAKLADMDPEGWQGMLCVETANAGPDALTLQPATTHTLRAAISVTPLDAIS